MVVTECQVVRTGLHCSKYYFYVMAYFDLGIFSHVLSCTFLSGFLGGISVAWLFFKSRSTGHVNNAAFSPENSSVCGEVSSLEGLCFVGRSVLCLEVNSNSKLSYFSLPEMVKIISSWPSLFDQT